jgi:proline dehydrogenase
MKSNMQFFNTLVARTVPMVPHALIRKISRRYIAGDNLNLAIDRIRQLNAQGYSVTIDVLGEVASSSEDALRTVDEYTRVLHAISTHSLNASISVKPTALGMLINSTECAKYIEELARLAQVYKTSICIDMEDTRCTQDEIDLFNHLRSRYSNVSLALQAYLNRTYQDIEPLTLTKSELRICKGIYVENRSHLVKDAWKDRAAINQHFLNHVERCFVAGSFVAVATHDVRLIEQVIALAKQQAIAPTAFEFQMLLGVCEALRDRLHSEGFHVRVYLPYGEDWYGYSTRRIKENPSIAGYILKSLLQR